MAKKIDLDVIESDEPIKKRKKKKDNLPPSIAFAVFVFEFIYMLFAVAHIATTNILPTKYIIALAAIIVVVSIIHFLLIFANKKKLLKSILSILLSGLMIGASWYASGIVKTVGNTIDELDLPEDEVEYEPVKVEKIHEESFLIYLSGLDTRGSAAIADTGLSDVNMVIAVNPNDSKILMVSIPRDCYVPLNGDFNKMDKLTHTGGQGISCSISTVSALLDVKFNYYAKVNFHSVVEVVNAVGGITVNSEKTFSSRHSMSGMTYTFYAGDNYLTGDAALAFVRERKSFANGDIQRGKNQQLVIKAILDKATSLEMLTPEKIETTLAAVTSHTKTNMSAEEIKKLVKFQLDKMPEWDVEMLSIVGDAGMEPCYLAGNARLSVLLPTDESLNEAKTAIKEILGQ